MLTAYGGGCGNAQDLYCDIRMKETKESKMTLPQNKGTSVGKVAHFDGVQRLGDFVLHLLNGGESTSK